MEFTENNSETKILYQYLSNSNGSSGKMDMEDTTPSDSGIQLLDSESNSDIMIESLNSQNDFDFEDSTSTKKDDTEDFINSNKEESNAMTTSNCSTFDTENIVYRRKVKKQNANPKSTNSAKKRVSFHEDILKNTRTDNIHIEHGFITYKNGRKVISNESGGSGRYSWCPGAQNESNQLYNPQKPNEASKTVYRNACSDVLDYGNSDIYQEKHNYFKNDSTGVFEYEQQKHLYKCTCSSSNSSLDSSDGSNNDNNSNKRTNYGQEKSSSCDCIGQTQNNINNNNVIGENCYYSEPSIDKSVWNKEKKPKNSCLKKTKNYYQYSNRIIQEHDLNNRVKTFNVHNMNNIIDNSKMIIGSLKSIFTMPLAERGVPEGSEDIQTVFECVPAESPVKQRPFLSKSLDGSKNKNNVKKFVHEVDDQLRRRNMEVENPPNEDYRDMQQSNNDSSPEVSNTPLPKSEVIVDNTEFRNKYIINCESTVFEHSGISISYEPNFLTGNDSNYEEQDNLSLSQGNLAENITPVAEPEISKSIFQSVQLRQTFSNIFKTFNNSPTTPTENEVQAPSRRVSTVSNENNKMLLKTRRESSSSRKSSSSSSPTKNATNIKNQTKHLSSPLKTQKMYATTSRFEYSNRMSPDLFNMYPQRAGPSGVSSRNTLSEEFDDILTITTTNTENDKGDRDIVIIDYSDNEGCSEISDQNFENNNFLKPPKTSLINRFLRNVTQKKMMENSIKSNDFFASKMKQEKKLFSGNLYLKGIKPKNNELIDDLNAEIALELENASTSASQVKNSPKKIISDQEIDSYISQYEMGIGEVSIELFKGKGNLHILRDVSEVLMKVFKLYTGYSLDGCMTPVLVFLTDKTLYVTDLVRNRLCNKFVLPYSELDVILLGPSGNTVLLSNCSRDKQQVLLAGGPYPANGLVANLELCARKGGSTLPAVGQLTLEHLASLQKFVRKNSIVPNTDKLLYYSVIHVPAHSLNQENQEPLGPHVKGFLMHRQILELNTNGREQWNPGFCLLKAGVLYMFNDSNQKVPSLAFALAECQGARRAIKTNRPHCFEILMKHELMQFAAPDEYVASEWLQALVQSASGLFEMQDKHTNLGCTLLMTENNLITLREDFTSPLKKTVHSHKSDIENLQELNRGDTTPQRNSSKTCTPNSTPTRTTSNFSTPTKLSQNDHLNDTPTRQSTFLTKMNSVYGHNSDVEILFCAGIKEMTAVRIPSDKDSWWCILEFDCQEVRENSDDLAIMFASSCEMQRFLRMLEELWFLKNNDLFPLSILEEDDALSIQCTNLYSNINRSWEPLLTAALGYPL